MESSHTHFSVRRLGQGAGKRNWPSGWGLGFRSLGLGLLWLSQLLMEPVGSSPWPPVASDPRLLSDPRSRALLTSFLGVCPCSGPADTRRCAHNIVCCSIKCNISYLLLAMHMLVVAVVSKLCFCLFFSAGGEADFQCFFSLYPSSSLFYLPFLC